MGAEPEAVPAALEAMLATGAPLGEAFAMAAQGFARKALLPHLVAALRGPDGWWHPDQAIPLLKAVAATDPELARMGLAAWAGGREVDGDLDLNGLGWVTSLPDGLRVNGFLDLNGSGLLSLPRGLRVGGILELGGTRVVALPGDLEVADYLGLLAAEAWDGQVPLGVRIGLGIQTDTHWEPYGIRLEEWRRRHPHGERD
jgi:hypothetical protein